MLCTMVFNNHLFYFLHSSVIDPSECYSPCLKALPNKHVKGEEIFIYLFIREEFFSLSSNGKWNKVIEVKKG
jgi:hypothetical protein